MVLCILLSVTLCFPSSLFAGVPSAGRVQRMNSFIFSSEGDAFLTQQEKLDDRLSEILKAPRTAHGDQVGKTLLSLYAGQNLLEVPLVEMAQQFKYLSFFAGVDPWDVEMQFSIFRFIVETLGYTPTQIVDSFSNMPQLHQNTKIGDLVLYLPSVDVANPAVLLELLVTLGAVLFFGVFIVEMIGFCTGIVGYDSRACNDRSRRQDAEARMLDELHEQMWFIREQAAESSACLEVLDPALLSYAMQSIETRDLVSGVRDISMIKFKISLCSEVAAFLHPRDELSELMPSPWVSLVAHLSWVQSVHGGSYSDTNVNNYIIAIRKSVPEEALKCTQSTLVEIQKMNYEEQMLWLERNGGHYYESFLVKVDTMSVDMGLLPFCMKQYLSNALE